MTDIHRLPVPLTDNWDWQAKGACRGMDSSGFFHAERERGPSRAAREEQAKQVCRRCPVLEECRRHALTVEEPYGVWGGQTETERRALLRERRHADRYPRGVQIRESRHVDQPAPSDGTD
jgi:WhiB family redox-sensing transcriptional regulator